MSRSETQYYGNGMRQNRINPVMVEGEVVISCFPDPVIMDRKKRDVEMSKYVYPGGGDDFNNYISRGEPVISLRDRQDGYEDTTEMPQVYGTTTEN
jgi:hypothetical protein